MKRFLIKVLIVGITIIAVLTSMELIVRYLPNEYSYKYKYLENHIDSIQVLVLGSSVGRSGIDPNCFEDYTFNAANVSQDIETDCSIVDKYLPRAKQLKTVIFTLLPGSYCSRMGEGIEHWRLRKYDIYMDLDIEKPTVAEKLEISDLNRTSLQLLKWLRGKRTVDCFDNGMGRDTIIESEEMKVSQGLSISKIHNEGYNPNNYSIIILKLNKVLSDCKEKKVSVLLVLMPSYHTYYNFIDNRMLAECDSISKQLASEYENVHYLNLFKDTTYTTNDFRNSNHLSPQGAKKISSYLNGYLK